jgi:hypothetical protein
MKIVSPIYKGKINLFGEIVDFTARGEAEVTEELWKKISETGFPNIFEKGQTPGIISKERDNFDKSLKEVNEEYMLEIDRLKKIIHVKEQEVAEAKQQTEVWKNTYKEETEKLRAQLLALTKTPAETAKPAPAEESSIEDDLLKELEAMKVPELRKAALEEGLDAEAVGKATKSELIKMIMKK